MSPTLPSARPFHSFLLPPMFLILYVDNLSYVFLVHEKVFRMIDMVVVRVLNPDPERLGKLSMDSVVPVELRLDRQYDSEHGARDWLDRSIDVQQRYPFCTLLHTRAHVNVTHHVTLMIYLSQTVMYCRSSIFMAVVRQINCKTT